MILNILLACVDTARKERMRLICGNGVEFVLRECGEVVQAPEYLMGKGIAKATDLMNSVAFVVKIFLEGAANTEVPVAFGLIRGRIEVEPPLQTQRPHG